MTREINEIIVHCSATRPEWLARTPLGQKINAIRKWHMKDRGWKDIGYATLIDRDGTVGKGRDLDQDGDTWDEIGAHTRGKNSRSVGVCLIGGFGSAATDKFEDHFTLAQSESLRDVIAEIEFYAGKKLKVSGHNQYANKACPGFNVPEWYKHKPPRKVTSSTTLQAAAVSAVATVGAAMDSVGKLGEDVQIPALIFLGLGLLAAAWIMRERLKKWARGVR